MIRSDGDDGVELDVILLQIVQPIPEKMEDEEEITNDQDAVDRQLDDKGKERLAVSVFIVTRARLHKLIEQG